MYVLTHSQHFQWQTSFCASGQKWFLDIFDIFLIQFEKVSWQFWKNYTIIPFCQYEGIMSDSHPIIYIYFRWNVFCILLSNLWSVVFQNQCCSKFLCSDFCFVLFLFTFWIDHVKTIYLIHTTKIRIHLDSRKYLMYMKSKRPWK